MPRRPRHILDKLGRLFILVLMVSLPVAYEYSAFIKPIWMSLDGLLGSFTALFLVLTLLLCMEW